MKNIRANSVKTKYYHAFSIGLLLYTMPVMAQIEKIEQEFKTPLMEQKPYVWWHWMGPNFSKEGITKDLEAMKEAGIGGATIFNITSAVQESHAPTLNNPWPEQTYRSPAYWEAMRHAAKEAKRLGLELGLHNTVGYSTLGGPWIDEQRSMQRVVFRDTVVAGGRIELRMPQPVLPPHKGWGAFNTKLPAPTLYNDLALYAVPQGKKVAITEIIDLTNKIDPATGLIQCELPQGDWRIVRYGHASTMAIPHPLPDELIGKTLEVDKMNAAHVSYHWDQVLRPLKKELGAELGTSLRHILIDSYEAGGQSWSDNFKKEFIKRKGYDPSKWMVMAPASVLAGEKKTMPDLVINDEEQSKRFAWDYRDVIEQLFLENSWQNSKKLVKAYGLELWQEPYSGPFNMYDAAANADVPMGEFWSGRDGSINAAIAATARTFDKKIVGAEAYTGSPIRSRWTEDPAFLKESTDGCFLAGGNRMILHHWVHQPFDDRYQPGMGMGWWGTHFGRNQTWFEPGKAFFDYLSRCQSLLQQGSGVGAYLSVGAGTFHSDAISVTDFLKMKFTVRNNRIVLPNGRSYPFIEIAGNGVVLPEVIEKVSRLATQGAVVVCARPLRSPSLKDYPKADETLRRYADQMWVQPTQNQVSKGMLFTNKEDAIAHCGVQESVILENKGGGKSAVSYLQRMAPEANIFFLANRADSIARVSASFLAMGGNAELWNPVDGNVYALTGNEKDGRTTLDLEFTPRQSYFIVFTQRKEPMKNLYPLFGLKPSGKQKAYDREWTVRFEPKIGSPFTRSFERLNDFSHHSDPEVLYFSGTAVYQKQIDWKGKKEGCRYILDLGTMNDIATVSVNGSKELVVWYAPYRLDITDMLKEGANKLVIRVTNNWANALIGDERLPLDFEYGKDRGASGKALRGYPEWFLKGQPRPSGRKTFVVWQYFTPDSQLQPAGLVGPVQIIEYAGN